MQVWLRAFDQQALRNGTLVQGQSSPHTRSVPVSVLDQFRDAEKRVAQRLKELEPAVAEYRDLEVVAQRLGIDTSATAPARAARTRRRKASAAPAEANGAAAPARRRPRNAPAK